MIIIKIFKHLQTKSYTITLKTEIKPFYGKKNKLNPIWVILIFKCLGVLLLFVCLFIAF